MGFLDGLWGGAKQLGEGAWNLGTNILPAFGQPGASPQQNDLLNRNNTLFGQQQDTFGEQQRLSNLLFSQAQGQGPSYAGLQLGQGLENIQRGAANAAAGAGGNEGVLARYAAINSAANAGAATNQQAAIARANEIAQARQQLGQNLGNMQTSTGGMYGTNLQGYTDLNRAAVEQQKNANADRIKIIGSVAQGMGAKGAQGLTG